MKQIKVDMGKCHTCGKRLYAVVDEIQFISKTGDKKEFVEVEAHCGKGGHWSRKGRVFREEFDAAQEEL